MTRNNSIKKTGFGIKQALIVAAAALAVVIVADIVMSLILLSFAIGSKSGQDMMGEPNYRISEEASAAITANTELLGKKTEDWLGSVFREPAQVTADDGAVLKADVITAENAAETHLWAIILHGYWRNRTRTYNYARFYAEKGYSLLLPDLRGHGESGGSYVGMGWLDRLDLPKWLELIIGRDPSAKIVIHGISMGAATAMMTAGEALPANVKAVVEDCGYTGVYEEFANVMSENAGMPEFPLLNTCDLLSGLLAGYTFREASALEQIKKAQVPVLFIHGGNDTFVKTEMVYRLYEACPTRKDIYIAEDAPHGKALYIDPEAYFKVVFGFLDEVL